MAKRTLSVALSIAILSTQCLFAYQPEMSVWAMRRESRTPSLPMSSVVSSPRLPARISSSAPLVARIEASLPASLVRTRRTVTGKAGGPSIIFIQDVHRNAEAQANIGRAVAALADSGLASSVALEGADGAIDISALRANAAPDALARAADFLLSRNEISGPVHAALTSAHDLRLVGADNAALHAANVAAYRNTRFLASPALRRLDSQTRGLAREKSAAFSAPLKTFDGAVQAYHDGASTLADFALGVAPFARENGQISLFLNALNLEKGVNAARMEAERARLVEKLVARLSTDDARALADAAVRFRVGSTSAVEFHRGLVARARKAGVSGGFPEIRSYLSYLEAAERIDGDALLAELSTAENAGYEALATTPLEKSLCDRSRQLSLSRKLVRFALNAADWNDYKVLSARAGSDRSLAPFEAFYEAAFARNEVLATAALRASTDAGNAPVVLVAGGFHAPGVTSLLTAAGASVVTLTPSVTRVDGEASAYLSAFTREKTPIEKLFEGERLFLAENPTVGLRQVPAIVIGVEEAQDPLHPLANADGRYADMKGFGHLVRSADVDGGAELAIADHGDTVSLTVRTVPSVDGKAPKIVSAQTAAVADTLLKKIRGGYRRWARAHGTSIRRASTVGEILIFFTAPFALMPVIGPVGVALVLTFFAAAHPFMRWLLLGEREPVTDNMLRLAAIGVFTLGYVALASGFDAAGLIVGHAIATAALTLAHDVYIAASPSLGLPPLTVLPDPDQAAEQFRWKHAKRSRFLEPVIDVHASDLLRFETASPDHEFLLNDALPLFIRWYGPEWVLAHWSGIAELQEANPEMFARTLSALSAVHRMGQQWVDENWRFIIRISHESDRPDLVIRTAYAFRKNADGVPAIRMFRDIDAMIAKSTDVDALYEAMNEVAPKLKDFRWEEIVELADVSDTHIDGMFSEGLSYLFARLTTPWVHANWTHFIAIIQAAHDDPVARFRAAVSIIPDLHPIDWSLMVRLAHTDALIGLENWEKLLYRGTFGTAWPDLVALVNSADRKAIFFDLPAQLKENDDEDWFRENFSRIENGFFRIVKATPVPDQAARLKAIFDGRAVSTLALFESFGDPFEMYARAAEGRAGFTPEDLLARHLMGDPTLELPKFPATRNFNDNDIRWLTEYVGDERLAELAGSRNVDSLMRELGRTGKREWIVKVGRLIGADNLVAAWPLFDLSNSDVNVVRVTELYKHLVALRNAMDGLALRDSWRNVQDPVVRLFKAKKLGDVVGRGELNGLRKSSAGIPAYLIDYANAADGRSVYSLEDLLAGRKKVLLPAVPGRNAAKSKEEFLTRISLFGKKAAAIAPHWRSVQDNLARLPPTSADRLIGTSYPALITKFGVDWVDARWTQLGSLLLANPSAFPLVIELGLPALRDGAWVSANWSVVVEVVRLTGKYPVSILFALRAIRKDVPENEIVPFLTRLLAVAVLQKNPTHFLRNTFPESRQALPGVSVEDRLQMAENAGAQATQLFDRTLVDFMDDHDRTFMRRHAAEIAHLGIAGANLIDFIENVTWLERNTDWNVNIANHWDATVAAASAGGLSLAVGIATILNSYLLTSRLGALFGYARRIEEISALHRAFTLYEARFPGRLREDIDVGDGLFVFFRKIPRADRVAVFGRIFSAPFMDAMAAAQRSLRSLIPVWSTYAKEPARLMDLLDHQSRGEFDYVPPAPVVVQPEAPVVAPAPVAVAPRPEPIRFVERERVSGIQIGRGQEETLRGALEEIFNRPTWSGKVRELNPDSSFYRALDPELALTSVHARVFVIDGLTAHVKKRAAQSQGRLPQALTGHRGLVMTVNGEPWILIDGIDHAMVASAREIVRLNWSRHMAWHAANPDGAEADVVPGLPRLPDQVVRRSMPSDDEINAAAMRGRDTLFAELPPLSARARTTTVLALDRILWPGVEFNLRREIAAVRFLLEEVWRVRMPLENDDLLQIARTTLPALIGQYEADQTVSSFVTRLAPRTANSVVDEIADQLGVGAGRLRSAVERTRELVAGRGVVAPLSRTDGATLASTLNAEFPDLARAVHAGSPVSLNDRRQAAARLYPGVIVDDALSPALTGLQEELVDLVERYLDPRSADIVLASFGFEPGGEVAATEIGARHSISGTRVSDLIAAALRKLHENVPAELADELLQVLDASDPLPVVAAVRRMRTSVPTATDHALTTAEEDALLDFTNRTLTRRQRELLPLVVRRASREQMLAALRNDSDGLDRDLPRLQREMGEWFTFGELRRYGSDARVASTLAMLLSETPLERSFRRENMTALLNVMRGDREGLKELILQLHPGEFTEEDIDALLGGHFGEIAARVTIPPTGPTGAGEILASLRSLVTHIEQERAVRRRLVLARFLRSTYYPVMRADEENGTKFGFAALTREIAASAPGTPWHELLVGVQDFYTQARAFTPRGFREDVAMGVKEPLIPAQRYGVWQAVQTLENPAERSALFTSEPRTGKTIMAILAALNIRRSVEEGGGFAVNRLLFTAPNISKNEAAAEFTRRVAPSLGFRVIVLNGPRSEDRDLIAAGALSPTPVAIFANYEAVRDLSEELTAFKPDAHIIDELENLRRGDETVRAPLIFGIPATYRIGVTARFIVKSGEDAAAPLHWLRPAAYPQADSALNRTADEIFAAKDPIEIRWRRAVVLPEIGDPRVVTERIPYGREQQKVVRAMRRNLANFLQTRAKADHRNKTDHVFTRIQLEQMASVDPAIFVNEFTELPPKLERMMEIIQAEKRRGGKVVVLVDFREGVDRVVALINARLGSDVAALATTGTTDVPLAVRNQRIEAFRSQPDSTVLVGTSFMLGSSLNLFQRPGAPFHISTMIRLSRPARNLDAGERLVGIGQTHPVTVYNLVNTFASGQGRTVEEMFEEMLADEQQVFEHIVDGRPLIDDESARRLNTIAGRMEAAVERARQDETETSASETTPSSLPYLIFLARTNVNPTIRQKLVIGLGGTVLEAAVLSTLALAAALLPGLHWDLLFVFAVLADVAAHLWLDGIISNPNAARAPPALHAFVLFSYVAAALFVCLTPWAMVAPVAFHLLSDIVRLFFTRPPSGPYEIHLRQIAAEGPDAVWVASRADGRSVRATLSPASEALSDAEKRQLEEMHARLSILWFTYEEAFMNPDFTSMIARVDGRVVGFYVFDNPRNKLEMLYVDPVFRGTGTADILLEDFVARVLGGDRTRAFRADVARDHARARAGAFNGTVDDMRERIGLNSRVTVDTNEIDRLERVSRAVPGESEDQMWRRHSASYDALLNILARGGLFKDTTVIVPASGIDAFPARHARTVAIDLKPLHDQAVSFTAGELGVGISAIDGNYRFHEGSAADPRTYERQFGAELTAPRRLVIVKGFSRYMFQSADDLRAYLGGLDTFLRPGDRVAFFDASDARRSVGWLAAHGYMTSEGWGSEADRLRVRAAVERIGSEPSNQDAALSRMHGSIFFQIPDAVMIYEKPVDPTSPVAAARAYASVLKDAGSGSVSAGDINAIMNGTPIRMGLDRLRRDGVSFDAFGAEQVRAFEDALRSELKASGARVSPAVALEAGISVAAALRPSMRLDDATAERNIFLPAGDENVERLTAQALSSLGRGGRLVAAVNSSLVRRALSARYAGDARVTIMSSEENGAAPVVVGREINPVAMAVLLEQAAGKDRSAWIAVRPLGLTFASGPEMMQALVRLDVAWLIMTADDLGTLLSTRSIEMGLKAALVAMQSA